MTIQITTTAAEYNQQLEIAVRILRDRMDAAIGDDDYLAEQLPKSLSDALNNTWYDGIIVRKWAEKAAKRVGL